MTATGGHAGAWMAAGVRQELLMRVLPALRHDMAGPLSVARMGNSVLKRYLAAQPFDPEQSRKRLEQTDEQLNQLLVAIRSLNRWDLDSAERAEAATTLREGFDLARPMLDLHGVVLEGADADIAAGWPAMPPARALYAALGALCYLQDTAAGPCRITVTPEADGFLLQSHAGDPDQAHDHLPASRALQVDKDALDALAQDLRWPMQVDTGCVRILAPA